MGVAGIVVEPTTDLLMLQQALVEAVAPFTVNRGSATAFATSPGNSDIQPALMDYVAAFVPKYTGTHYNPHVTIGVASQDYLKGMLAEPFKVFTFSPAGASIYQLGSYGTAMKKLHAWNLTR